MQRLTNMAARLLARNLLAFLMLFAVCAPYLHAAAEIGKHEQCSMEMCKRTGKCCCRQNNIGKPQWGSMDVCHPGSSQLPRTISPDATLSAEAHRLHGLALIAKFAVADSVVKPVAPLTLVRFQRPPPSSL